MTITRMRAKRPGASRQTENRAARISNIQQNAPSRTHRSPNAHAVAVAEALHPGGASLTDLEIIADNLQVEIRYVLELRRGRWGEYHDKSRTIWLNYELGPLQARSTLAHELAHAALRHRSQITTQERDADTIAAALLISAEQWEAATAAYEHRLSVAVELAVHPKLVDVYAQRVQRHRQGGQR